MVWRGYQVAAMLAAGAVAMPLYGQSFGMAKDKVTLQRKLPALMKLPGDTLSVKVTAAQNVTSVAPALSQDLQALLLTELLKDDSRLRQEDNNPDSIVTCEITNVSPPQRTVTQRPNLLAGRTGPKTIPYTRITASLSVSFQAKTRDGHMLGSDNVTENYDQEFDSSGNNASHGIMGSMTSGWHKLKGATTGDKDEDQDDQPPTDSELRNRLLMMAVQRMAEQIVNTTEKVDVYLARGKGDLDAGDKSAEDGQWERALESFETAQALPKKEDDAYRLYNIGVADEALGYAATDPNAAMKMLDDAAVNYGKAIDARPAEKYFLDPQKRIETALAQYHKLGQQNDAPAVVAHQQAALAAHKENGSVGASDPPPSPAPAASSSSGHALTNAQITAMARAGMDDATIIQTVKGAKAVNFDLTAVGRKHLADSGVSAAVISAMKARAIQDLSAN
jgi:tetratricopeptide (TPR) repeat protein